MAKSPTPKPAASINITKFEDPTVPFRIVLTGVWTPIDLNALEMLIRKEHRRHVVQMRNKPQELKGQES